MLAAEKAQLRTSLAVEQLQLRDKELNYYLNTMSSVSTQATLLAGFAFAQLTGYEYDDPDEGYFTFEQLDALGIGHTSEDASQRGIAGWSWLTWTKQILQLCFIVSTAACMFLQLWAVQACTVSTVMGQGLALRGPDGSMDKAVRHMARQSRATYAMFSLGIMLIKASTIIFIVNSFSVFVSVPTAILCTIIAFRSYTSEQVLNSIFHIPGDEVVSAAVVEHQEHHQAMSSKRHDCLLRIPCVGGLLRKMQEVEMSVDDDVHDEDDLAASRNSSADVDALIARNQEAGEQKKAATAIQARVRGRRNRRATALNNRGGRKGSGRASPADGGGGGSSVDASPVVTRPPVAMTDAAFAQLSPASQQSQTDAMGRISSFFFGNFLDEVVGDFKTVAGSEAAGAVPNNPAMLELAQRHHAARDEARDERDGQPISPNVLKQHNLAKR